MNKVWAQRQKKAGFTIVELLIVIVVISILAAITIVAYNGIQDRAQDTRRLHDAQTIEKALRIYAIRYGDFPPAHDSNLSWEQSFYDTPADFIKPLVDAKVLGEVPVDPVNTSAMHYRYYVYTAGYSTCDPAKGKIAVFQMIDMKTSDRPHPNSPGFSCVGGRDWGLEADYTVGMYLYG